MATRTFKKYDILEATEDPVETRTVDKWRWGHVLEVIFEYEGKFWAITVRVHSQEGWEPLPSEVEATEVVKKERVVIDWVPVEP